MKTQNIKEMSRRQIKNVTCFSHWRIWIDTRSRSIPTLNINFHIKTHTDLSWSKMQNFGGGKKQKLLNTFSSPSATLSTESRDGTWKYLRTFWEKYFGDSWILIKRVLPFWKLSGILLRQMEKHCREIRSPWLLHKPAERNFLSLLFNTKIEERRGGI